MIFLPFPTILNHSAQTNEVMCEVTHALGIASASRAFVVKKKSMKTYFFLMTIR